ncbi:MAG: preprotein translocase subunit SecG [Endomicrobium sp.]|jgi:preprotein translocase subunit SecG|nr:preprotein translocase subunit SecG [Endomicrobium sp.]
MNILLFALKFLHYLVCIVLIFIVLLQTSKSGGMAGIFGGGGSDQIFNAPSGMAFIKKLTIAVGCMFLFTSLMLTKLSSNVTMMSVMRRQFSDVHTSAPVEPVSK